ncbi:MAG TPA: DUF1583 domain-containing protein, partial [Gemmataceae bacterium]
RAASRGQGQSPAHWAVVGGGVRHLPGHHQDYLYLRVPLRGEFEVTADLTTGTTREAHLGYGGLRVELKNDRKGFDFVGLDRRLRSGTIDPPLAGLGEWYHHRLVVKDGQWTALVNDRQVAQEPLPADPDPWLVLHASRSVTSGVRNLRITGQPTVPDVLHLSAAGELTGWRSYQRSPIMSANTFESSATADVWAKRGEEILGGGGRVEQPDGRPAPRSYAESALHYHRPLLEDGTIECEFYYEPEKFHVHPALDRLCFLLDPKGVQVHWLTEGPHDRTGLPPENATTEPQCRRGPAMLPLKPKAWNRLALTLAGDTVTLRLNGEVVYERPVESTNQRTFGLFHYVDDTAVRVRNVTYRGQWPKVLPPADTLFKIGN